MRKRPLGITILAIFQATIMGLGLMLIALFTLLLELVTLDALGLIFGGESGMSGAAVEREVLLTYSFTLLISGVVMLIGAIGLWLMQRWGWFVSLSIWTLNLVVTIAQITAASNDIPLIEGQGIFPPIPRIILCVVVLGYLLLPRVSQSFIR
jgi:uncharacterized membrane protein